MDPLNPPIEIRYLAITWRDRDTVVQIHQSREVVPVVSTDTEFNAVTTTFTSVYHYIGIRLTDSSALHTPYFLLADGSKEELHPVKTPGSDEVWWIQSNKWDSKGKRHLSELYRTSGRVDLVTQNIHVHIENNTVNFTISELEYYLADFKDKLWLLILDNKSAANANVAKEIPNLFDDDILAILTKFVDNVEAIVSKPNMTLVESQGKRNFRSVKPLPRTFREFATNPTAKLLTSRIFLESYDTAENRYIHHCVNRILYIVKNILAIAQSQRRIYAQKEAQESYWRETYQNANTKRIDHEVYDSEISKFDRDISKINESVTKLVSDTPSSPDGTSIEHGQYTIKVGSPYRTSSTQFYANKLNGENFRVKYDGSYLVVEFPSEQDLKEAVHSASRGELSIEGYYVKSREQPLGKKPYFQIKFLTISSISVVRHPFQIEAERLKNRRKELVKNDWIVPLTRDEVRDRDMEAKVSATKSTQYKLAVEQMVTFAQTAPSIIKRLTKASLFLQKHKVKAQVNFPNSMVFIQNPPYVAAKSYFKKITAMNGLDENVLNSLVTIDSIGLVNIANLYEKWCLLQIVDVLSNVYSFDLQDDWQQSLIAAVLNKETDIQIALSSPERQQQVILTYEKTLNNRKRPDFTIDLISKNYVVKSDTNNVWEFDGEYCNRLVLDAKFRGHVTETALRELVRNLYEDKDYSEGNSNPVFVIHPSPEAIQRRTSPLTWGNSCDYGQNDDSNHRFGSIFLSPTLSDSRSIDNLQRLIGLHLQEHSEILFTKDGDSKSEISNLWHNMSCISCGNSAQNALTLHYEPTKAGNDRWEIRCHSCYSMSIKTICYSCKRDLFKNGVRWTYHRSRAEQSSNVVCPKCETFL